MQELNNWFLDYLISVATAAAAVWIPKLWIKDTYHSETATQKYIQLMKHWEFHWKNVSAHI